MFKHERILIKGSIAYEKWLRSFLGYAIFISRYRLSTDKRLSFRHPSKYRQKKWVCKKEESFDGRWIQCDTCHLWYHTTCVMIKLNDSGEFNGDYYCQLCTGVSDPIIPEIRPSEEDCQLNNRLSPSSSTSSSSGASGHSTKKFKNGSSHTTPSLSPFMSTSFLEIGRYKMGNNHLHRNYNNHHDVEEIPKRKKFSDKPISRPYDWPNPVPYSRAIIRMSQIREFILTHCPKAVAVGMDIDDSSEPKPKSLQMAEDLWKKLDLLEQKYSQHNQISA
ncbi:hypothetical protein GLOIN_2v1592026 [Rhizophagus clarus]|uniref:Zinc finger PHD-type domain-containing protein n=1 Tax=Rhizophagus clarus TaxID=94130 RepID=A0A8H3LNY6_9GLOM|nr:hypothetical protein GLOIN_2v1592026 [Rhizophagus clarus]